MYTERKDNLNHINIVHVACIAYEACSLQSSPRMGNGVSALHTAAMQGDLKALRIAVQEQPSALDAAEPVVRFVAVAVHKHSSNINLTTQSVAQNGYTALHIAASKGFDALVRELLARNAAPNIKAKVNTAAGSSWYLSACPGSSAAAVAVTHGMAHAHSCSIGYIHVRVLACSSYGTPCHHESTCLASARHR